MGAVVSSPTFNVSPLVQVFPGFQLATKPRPWNQDTPKPSSLEVGLLYGDFSRVPRPVPSPVLTPPLPTECKQQRGSPHPNTRKVGVSQSVSISYPTSGLDQLYLGVPVSRGGALIGKDRKTLCASKFAKRLIKMDHFKPTTQHGE